MSKAAKASLLGSIVIATATIWFVHHQQTDEREKMHAGVLRDDERRKAKMEQRLKDLQESQAKRAIYEKVQRVDTES